MRRKDAAFPGVYQERQASPLDKRNVCIHCMSKKAQQSDACPRCHKKNERYTPSSHHLPPLTLLNNGKYLLGRVISEGTSSITYLAMDTNLRMPVAVKELFLNDICHRNSGNSVSVPTSAMQLFAESKNRFLMEARLLAMFNDADLEGVISVKAHFEENNTAYVVTEHLSGITVKEYVQQNGAFNMVNATNIIQTVGVTLAHMHRMGYIHTAVGPDSIILVGENKVKLTNFGSVRKIGEPISDNSISFVRDYAPPEQYANNSKIGPWTDIYALAATMRFCLTAAAPPNYSERQAGTALASLSSFGVKLKPKQEAALNAALDLNYEKRPALVEDFLKVFRKRSNMALKIAAIAAMCILVTAIVVVKFVPAVNPGGTAISAKYSVGDAVPFTLGTYIVENYADSSYIMGIDSGFGDNGAHLVLKKYEEANRNRLMVTNEVEGDGFYTLQIAHTSSFLQTNGTAEAGAPIIQHTQLLESGAEKWYFVYCGTEEGKDYFIMKNAAGLVIAPKGGRMEGGNDLVLTELNMDDPSQMWHLRWNPKDSSESNVIVHQEGDIMGSLVGTYSMISSFDGITTCSVSSDKSLTEPQLIIWENVSGVSQQFRLEKAGEYRYRIYPVMQDGGIDKCLEYNESDGRIVVRSVSDNVNQLFRIRYAGYNTYLVQAYNENVIGYELKGNNPKNGQLIVARPYEDFVNRTQCTWLLNVVD